MPNKFVFSEENINLASTIISKYPADNRFSAIMPLLTLAQKQNSGHLTNDIITYLANYLQVSEMSFYEVANFYSMYRFTPIGKYHIQVCKSVVCLASGMQSIYDYCKGITGTQISDVSEDGLFSVQKVECLGACVNAVAIKINDLFHEDVSEKGLKDLIEALKQGAKLEDIVVKSIKKPLIGS